MVEQWIIDKLTPLKGEKLIILADPQRVIRAGAQAVDGWAKEHNRSGGTSVVRVARPSLGWHVRVYTIVWHWPCQCCRAS